MNKVMNPVARAEAELAEIEEAQRKLTVSGEEPPNPPEHSEEKPPAPSEEAPTEQPPVPPAAPPRDEEESYKQKWKSLEGIVRAKDTQIQTLIDQNHELTRQLTEISTRLVASPANTTHGDPGSAEDHLSDLIEEYGEPMLKAIQRVAQVTLGDKVASLERRIAELSTLTDKVNTVEKNQLTSDSERFKAGLTQRVADWREIVANPDFDDWKATTVEQQFTGKTFAELYDMANTSWNMEGLVGVFNAYKQARGMVPPAPNNTPPPSPPADPRQKLVVPGARGNADVPPSQPQPKEWTQSEVSAVYDRMRRGMYTPEEAARLDREIFDANVNGRIRPG